jgi:hypothetical protein
MAFPAHSFAHAFVPFLFRHLVPAASLGFALFFYLLYLYAYTKKSVGGKIVISFFLIFVIFTGIERSELPVLPEKIKAAKDFLIFKNCLLKLRALSYEKDLASTNYYRFPFMRHYTDRNCRYIFDKATLEKTLPLPRYFIFIPYQHQSALELLNVLRERYEAVKECKSQRFPSIIFKLKELPDGK